MGVWYAEKIVCYSMQGHMGKYRDSHEAEEQKQNVARASVVVFMGKARQCRVSRLRTG